MALPTRSKISQIVIRTAIVLAIAYVLLNLGIALRKNYAVNTTIRALKTEIAALQQRITVLGYKIVYLQSTSYRELEAKRRLGLKRTGEQVVLVPSNISVDESPDRFTPARPTLTIDQSQPAIGNSWAEQASVNAATWLTWLRGN